MPIPSGDTDDTRRTIGGTSNDLALRRGLNQALYLDDGTLTWWTQETGGTQLTDLILNDVPVTSIPVPRSGQIPRHQWPNGVTAAWAQVDGGPRILFTAGQVGAPGIGIPPGGTFGQVLAKNSDFDLDTEWVDPAEGGGGGTVPDANTTTKGKVQLATPTQTVTGEADDVVATPEGVHAAITDLTDTWGVMPTIYINPDGSWPGRIVPAGYDGIVRWDSGTTPDADQPPAAVSGTVTAPGDRWLRKKP